MDFFATGGFQQLFNDLDEQMTEHDLQTSSTDLCSLNGLTSTALAEETDIEELHYNWRSSQVPAIITATTPPPPPTTATTTTTPTTAIDYIYGGSEEEEALFGSQKDTISGYAYYELISLTDRINDAEENQLNDSYGCFETTDWNNNSYHNDDFHVNEKQLQRSFDLMLPTEDEESGNELSMDYLLTREMTDWEERFLDNYIEIPELVEFLPEKTPLCTDECELFLQESSKNLKLHRKRKQNNGRAGGRSSGNNGNNDNNGNNGEGNEKVGYVCTFGDCQKVYAKPAHLKAHLRRHLGEKPYVCNWPDCTWKFSRSDELARHRRSHSGVKPYKCDYCTKCFARSDHLTKHRKVHERRLLAASKAGKVLDAAALPYSILTVRPGRKRKNQIC